jgi:hypothetical protein
MISETEVPGKPLGAWNHGGQGRNRPWVIFALRATIRRTGG